MTFELRYFFGFIKSFRGPWSIVTNLRVKETFNEGVAFIKEVILQRIDAPDALRKDKTYFKVLLKRLLCNVSITLEREKYHQNSFL